MPVKQTVEDQRSLTADPNNLQVDLVVWAQACWASRWKIIAAICVAIVAVTALNLTKPIKYRSTALISLTKSAGSQLAKSQNPLFWPNEDLVSQAADRYKIDLSAGRVSVTSSFQQNISGFGAAVIDVTAASPKTARRMAKGITDLFVDRSRSIDPSTERLRHLEKKQAETLKLMARRRKLANEEGENLASQYRSLKKTVSELGPDTLTFAILNNQLISLENNSPRIESRLIDIEQSRLEAINTLKLQTVAEGRTEALSVSAAKRVRPRLATDAVFAGLAAFLASIIVVFVRQNMVSRRN